MTGQPHQVSSASQQFLQGLASAIQAHSIQYCLLVLKSTDFALGYPPSPPPWTVPASPCP